jgi:hypothetical protein
VLVDDAVRVAAHLAHGSAQQGDLVREFLPCGLAQGDAVRPALPERGGIVRGLGAQMRLMQPGRYGGGKLARPLSESSPRPVGRACRAVGRA